MSAAIKLLPTKLIAFPRLRKEFPEDDWNHFWWLGLDKYDE